MNKLKSIIQYECITSFKYIWIFYGIQYAAISLVTLIIGLFEGTFEGMGTNTLEINTLVYVSILGVLSFKEDFKTLIQNGFTRKYIFIATFSMIFFIAGSMAFVDTLVGTIIRSFNDGYMSLYGLIYGHGSFIINWLWLFLIYVLVCGLMYLGALVLNKLGKIMSICLVVLLGSVMIALFGFVFSSEILSYIVEFFKKAMGFMADGTVNHFISVLTLFIIIAVSGIASYSIIRKTELK